jgi:hypothetical protein
LIWNLDDIMSEAVGYYLMSFRVLHFMNSRCWRPFYELSDCLYIENMQMCIKSDPYIKCGPLRSG